MRQLPAERMVDKKIVVISLIFLISVFIRIPNLNRPVSKHHEFNTAFFLIPMEIWKKEGIAHHGFLPPYNYPNDNDKFIAEPIGIEEGNKHGTYYYLSFPSLSYVAPYAVFSALHLDPTPLNLQLFNLLLHFIICVLLFRLFNTFFSYFSSLTGVGCYLFSPGTLWFHGNGYTHHIFAIFPLVVVLFYLVRIIDSTKQRTVDYIMYSTFLFFLFLTEWISVLFVLTLIASFVLLRNVHATRKVVVYSVLPALLAGGVILVQHSYYFNIKQYINYQLNRVSHRSTFVNDDFGLWEQIFAWMKWTVVSYGPWIILIAALGGLYLMRSGKRIPPLPVTGKQLFLVLLVPPLLYHILFMEFTVSHDYSVIMDGLFWSFMLAWLSSLLHLTRKRMLLLTGAVIVVSIAQYYFINRPGIYNQNGDLYSIYMDIGERIKNTSTPEETIFVTGFDQSVNPNNPQIMYYAKRNFKPVRDMAEAQKYMRDHHRSQGKLYVLTEGKVGKIIQINH